jgi:hypothetical protein
MTAGRLQETAMLDLILRFSPFMAMAMVVCTNHFIQHRRQQLRIEREAGKLASLLTVELKSLVEHYRDILGLLDGGKSVLPLRGSGQVFRAHVGRLTGLLEEEALVPLVACHAHHERIEAQMQACVKPNAGFSLRVELDDVLVARLAERLGAGCDLAETAIAALAADPHDVARRPLSWSSAWAFWREPRVISYGDAL